MITLPHERELRGSIRLLRQLLARVIHHCAGPEIFGTVEELRRGFISLRNDEDPTLRRRMVQIIDTIEPKTASQVVRAFQIYFNLLNIAEEKFKLGQRRKAAQRGSHLWPGSFHDTLYDLKQAGVNAAEMQTLLDELLYLPVLTAHPTETKRRTVKEALRNIFVGAEELDDPRVQGILRDKAIRSLNNQIRVLWQTDEVRAQKISVIDEVNTGLFYFPISLFDAVLSVYRNLEETLAEVYDGYEFRVPSFLQFGSWIGGDRDGNPFVKPETTAQALRLQSQTILTEYGRRLEELRDILTHSTRLCRPSEEFIQSLDSDVQLYAAQAGLANAFTLEPYRRKLAIMAYRIRRNLDAVNRRLAGQDEVYTDEKAYSGAAAFLADLHLIRDSLLSHGDASVAGAELHDLIRLTATFGFHLMPLDVRQESSRHTDAVAEILKASLDLDYTAFGEEERLQFLGDAIANANLITYELGDLSEATRETVRLFQVMAQMRREISSDCFGRYVISMTHEASHVLEVMFLAAQTGLAGKIAGRWYSHVGISPLFETIHDLERIEPVLRSLFGVPAYRELLNAFGEGQEIMLGYSDSCKDGGILASAWNLYEAQKKITAIGRENGIACRIFHGRGGTVGRGGGPTHEAIKAQPPGTVQGKIKFTEQGEVIFYKYNNMETAIYELTMGVTGLIKASLDLIRPHGEDRKDYLGVMDEIAEFGEEAFRRLTEREPGFLDYFYEATPLTEIGRLNIGSRPSHRRKGDRSKSSVRAIAWVFSWAQSRQTLPAWFGLGTALETWRGTDPGRLAKLQTMYREWPFFRTLLSNAQMALSKSDMDIARGYAGLCENPETGRRIYTLIEGEYRRTICQILNIADINTLLEENPDLRISLVRRKPYLDPLNYLQIAMLKRVRAEQGESSAESPWLEPLLRSINAIAAGMRNTG